MFFLSLLRSLPSQATIDFLGLRWVRLNLKNALLLYCIPILSSVSLSFLYSQSHSSSSIFSLSLTFSLSLSLADLVFAMLAVLQFTRKTCAVTAAARRMLRRQSAACCLLSVCVSSCTYAGSVRANSLSASHKIKQYPSLIWHFGATLMRFVTAATSSWPLPHFGSLAGWHL